MTMHYTVERLLRGVQAAVEHFQLPAAGWAEIFSRAEAEAPDARPRLLQSQQMWFERNCGGRWPGQEVMVLTGFGILYTTEAGFAGNGHRARILARAFAKSMCSSEVKSIAQAVVRQYEVPTEEPF